jgi:hypothetical protein
MNSGEALQDIQSLNRNTVRNSLASFFNVSNRQNDRIAQSIPWHLGHVEKVFWCYARGWDLLRSRVFWEWDNTNKFGITDRSVTTPLPCNNGVILVYAFNCCLYSCMNECGPSKTVTALWPLQSQNFIRPGWPKQFWSRVIKMWPTGDLLIFWIIPLGKTSHSVIRLYEW